MTESTPDFGPHPRTYDRTLRGAGRYPTESKGAGGAPGRSGAAPTPYLRPPPSHYVTHWDPSGGTERPGVKRVDMVPFVHHYCDQGIDMVLPEVSARTPGVSDSDPGVG